eukprot:CAMPEP_0170776188 /NCGR_PEP_ID=MMETSP0733-20121128/11014_1 /TAXON_ID=186038 /ORGANISM="Fragilariopsis kerguelensis, Strain L26-C5" /LENGTH=123 /DNA_ID=CAMNT_0011119107 /DNA_START=921 /DNA_END=1291 /DNA_ORIENTATION=+
MTVVSILILTLVPTTTVAAAASPTTSPVATIQVPSCYGDDITPVSVDDTTTPNAPAATGPTVYTHLPSSTTILILTRSVSTDTVSIPTSTTMMFSFYPYFKLYEYESVPASIFKHNDLVPLFE